MSTVHTIKFNLAKYTSALKTWFSDKFGNVADKQDIAQLSAKVCTVEDNVMGNDAQTHTGGKSIKDVFDAVQEGSGNMVIMTDAEHDPALEDLESYLI